MREKLIKKDIVSNKVKQKNTIEKLFAPKFNDASFFNFKKNIQFVKAIKLKEKICPIIPEHLMADLKSQSLIDANIAIEKLEQAKLFEEPKTKKQNTLLSLVFLAINIALVVIIAKSFFSSTQDLDLGTILKNQGNQLWWLLGAVVCLIVMVFAETAIFTVLIKHTTGKFRSMLSYKTAITGKYYESVTPLAVGMQPSQIIYMSKRDVAPGIATSIPIIRMIVYNSIFAVISLLFFVFVLPTLSVASELDALLQIIMKILACIGLIISSITVIVILIIATNKSFGKKLSRWVIKLGVSLHIVKNYRQSYNKLMKQVLEFQSSIDYLKKNMTMLFLSVTFCAIEILCFISIPFFVTLAFTPTEYFAFNQIMVLWLECSARFLMCFMASSFIPLPGGTGMMEVSFICLFGTSAFIGATNIFWGFLTFRLLTYYQWIIQGLILIVCDIISMAISKKLKKRKN